MYLTDEKFFLSFAQTKIPCRFRQGIFVSRYYLTPSTGLLLKFNRQKQKISRVSAWFNRALRFSYNNIVSRRRGSVNKGAEYDAKF